MYVFLFIWYYSTNYLLKLQGYLVLLYKKVSFIDANALTQLHI